MADIMGMMKKAQAMQAELQQNMARMTEELLALSITGSSGAGMITVIVDGKNTVKSLSIDPQLMTEDKEVLEDLIVAAMNDAKAKVEKATAERMQTLTGGLPLPPGLGNLFG